MNIVEKITRLEMHWTNEYINCPKEGFCYAKDLAGNEPVF